MKRRAILIVSFMSIILVGNAQVSNLIPEKFDTHMYDFGLVKEGDTATCVFTFTNTGTDTILLKRENIRVGCAHLGYDYTHTPILPGGKGAITTKLMTKSHVGPFNKSIMYLHDGKQAVILYIMGIVKTPEDIPAIRPVDNSSKVSIDRTLHDFGKAQKSEVLQTSFLIKNHGNDTLRITSGCGCYCIKHTLSKEKNAEPLEYVLPGKSAVLNLTYSNSIPGNVTNQYLLFTNSREFPVVTLTLKAEIEALTVPKP